MRSTFQIERPKELEMTLTITLRLKEWIELRAQLQNCYPSWKLSSVIDTMVTKATKEFVEYKPDETEAKP